MPNTNLENSKINMKTRIRNRVQAGQSPRDLGRLAKSARFVGLTDDAEVETDIDTQMAAAIPTASIDDLVEMSEGLAELRTGAADMGRVSNTDNLTEGGNKFLKAENVQPALSVSGDLSYTGGVVSYTAPAASALQVVATVGDLPTGASPGDQAVVQSNNKLYIRTADGWYAVALINTAPSISGNDASYELATDGTPTVITMTATDPENDPVTFSYAVSSGSLEGTTVEQNDNVFTVTPHNANPATFSLTFSADDSVNVATSSSDFSLNFAPDFSGHFAEATPYNSYYQWGGETITSFAEYDAMTYSERYNSSKNIRAQIHSPRINSGLIVNLGTTATLKGFVVSGANYGAGGGAYPFGGTDTTSVFNVDTNQWEVLTTENKQEDRRYGAPSLFAAPPHTNYAGSTINNSQYEGLNPAWPYGETGVRINKIKIQANGPGPGSSHPGYGPRGIFLIF